ncbi:alpha-ketoacid dehydrogenase subunit beta [Streptomyces fuscichromogenes]|uniref:Pyruvate dehydrogenase subunit beta n=1 Tax=Streptomyces fuscichromogenes TaxID=1324013 RepID=A0A918CPT4_9ACTN|nr:transketolase C-terminal domain-containing protein [Streptomyces fuscichromogenes]GGM98346.1 pyruvate dehydrogenase subunit beta [Streptomyces fuscichromogenes]
MTTGTYTMRQALHTAFDSALAEDSRVFMLGEDIADPGGGVTGLTKGLSTTYGKERVRDTPISEAAIAGAAVGAALEGMLPVAEIMIMDFVGIALDQIANHAAKARFMSAGRTPCPVTFRTPVYGGSGNGATHSQSLEAWFMHVPGLKVIVPSTPADAEGLLRSAIFDPDPCVFIDETALHGTRGPRLDTPDRRVPLGKADVKRPGTDLTVITYGRGVRDALAAAESLSRDGIEAEVVDLRTLLPLDLPTVLDSVGRTRRAVIAHYAVEFAGPGAELAARISHDLFGRLAAPVARVGSRFMPIPASTRLESQVSPSPQKIEETVRKVMEDSRG